MPKDEYHGYLRQVPLFADLGGSELEVTRDGRDFGADAGPPHRGALVLQCAARRTSQATCCRSWLRASSTTACCRPTESGFADRRRAPAQIRRSIVFQ